MLAEFIVLFRESIEAALIIGIMLTFLHKTKNIQHEKHIWVGACSGVLASIIFAIFVSHFLGGFKEIEEVFEGVFMIMASLLVTWFMLWMIKQKDIEKKIQADVKATLLSSSSLALFSLAFVSVFREGVESVLFLAGIYLSTGSLSLVSSILGLASAVMVGIAIFEYSKRVNLHLFFKITTTILALLSAGLLSQGVHELQEAGILPTSIKSVYDFTPPINSDGSYPLFHEKGYIGSILKGLIGYDTNPSLEQFVVYFTYLIIFFFIYMGNKN
ncbi:MAG: FTR1 family protein [Candidatus Anstonellales archaeon]